MITKGYIPPPSLTYPSFPDDPHLWTEIAIHDVISHYDLEPMKELFKKAVW